MQSCGLVIDHPKDTPEWEEARLRLADRTSSKGKKSVVPAMKKSRKEEIAEQRLEDGAHLFTARRCEWRLFTAAAAKTGAAP